jgi:hypothetical protein
MNRSGVGGALLALLLLSCKPNEGNGQCADVNPFFIVRGCNDFRWPRRDAATDVVAPPPDLSLGPFVVGGGWRYREVPIPEWFRVPAPLENCGPRCRLVGQGVIRGNRWDLCVWRGALWFGSQLIRRVDPATATVRFFELQSERPDSILGFGMACSSLGPIVSFREGDPATNTVRASIGLLDVDTMTARTIWTTRDSTARYPVSPIVDPTARGDVIVFDSERTETTGGISNQMVVLDGLFSGRSYRMDSDRSSYRWMRAPLLLVESHRSGNFYHVNLSNGTGVYDLDRGPLPPFGCNPSGDDRYLAFCRFAPGREPQDSDPPETDSARALRGQRMILRDSVNNVERTISISSDFRERTGTWLEGDWVVWMESSVRVSQQRPELAPFSLWSHRISTGVTKRIVEEMSMRVPFIVGNRAYFDRQYIVGYQPVERGEDPIYGRGVFEVPLE